MAELMRNGKPLRLTVEEGQGMLRIALSFGLPEKLGDTQHSVMERSLAADEVKKFYRELKARSPMLSGKKRYVLFGPGDNYEETRVDNGAVNHTAKDLDLEVPVSLDEDARSGAVWCLIVAVHPASPLCQTAGTQADVF